VPRWRLHANRNLDVLYLPGGDGKASSVLRYSVHLFSTPHLDLRSTFLAVNFFGLITVLCGVLQLCLSPHEPTTPNSVHFPSTPYSSVTTHDIGIPLVVTFLVSLPSPSSFGSFPAVRLHSHFHGKLACICLIPHLLGLRHSFSFLVLCVFLLLFWFGVAPFVVVLALCIVPSNLCQ
jgi:hypothetical protein